MLGSCIYNIENLPSLQNTNAEQHPQTKKSFTIAVEGNIGSGKTTFLEHFKTHPRVEVLPEPVEKWKSVKGFNSLDMMYKDAARWSLAFQSYVTLTMVEHHENQEDKQRIKMIERSIYSCRYCFVENLHQSGLMPDIDYNILSEWHDWINKNAETNIDLIVYLRASPENCHDRIHKRDRKEEKGVPIEYLRVLHKLHEEWLVDRTRGVLPSPVMVIDADLNMEELKNKIIQLEPQILGACTSTDS